MIVVAGKTNMAACTKSKLRSPELIVHCDWSKDENKRWMAKAVLENDSYTAYQPEKAGELSKFLGRIESERGGDRSALIGFDFPIGIPKAYADKIGVPRFSAFLKSLSPEAEFFQVCRHQNDISLKRPFYPYAPGGASLAHLTDALDIARADLFRACDQATENRDEASALFWTIGAKQVGKAAIVGWRDVLAPALRNGEISIWPLHGSLETLLQPNSTVIAETYPAQYYSEIFGALNGSKTEQAVRAQAGSEILMWAESQAGLLELSDALSCEIRTGFRNGEDAFDAAIGLFGMIDALQNCGAASEPQDPTIRNIEGWILGQPAR